MCLTSEVHFDFIGQTPPPDPEFLALLRQRKVQLSEKMQQAGSQEAAWCARSYPALAVVAPVLSSSEGKIEFPGDPMCLYWALSWAIEQIVKTKQAGLADGPYNDLCPRWGDLPSRDYRCRVKGNVIREIDGPRLNTDQMVFDPRVWNPEVKSYFGWLLETIQPKIVLISAISPAHRYALDIARTVRRYDPRILIVFGGRHMDETLHYHSDTQTVELAYSHPLRAIADGRVEACVDFTISGEGYYAVDLLLKAVSVAMDLEHQTASVGGVIERLKQLAPTLEPPPGQAVIAALEAGRVHAFPLSGRIVDLADLPSPYRPFAIRAHFPVFHSATGAVQRTAHMLTTSACPYHCNYCSESVEVVGYLRKFIRQPVPSALERVYEAVSYGAEALFFDDSIFWGGDARQIQTFCNALIDAKANILSRPTSNPWLRDAKDAQNLERLQWGAQLTAELITSFRDRHAALNLFTLLNAAGCTYIYVGIESMAAPIMEKIHKYLPQQHIPWKSKIRDGLELLKTAGLRVGASVLFGLDGETRATIEETISDVAQLIHDDLLLVASPNICTYHPATEMTRRHQMEKRLDYISLEMESGAPYIYFEEAFRNVVSTALTEEDIWYIHHQTKLQWAQTRNLYPMAATVLPKVERSRR